MNNTEGTMTDTKAIDILADAAMRCTALIIQDSPAGMASDVARVNALSDRASALCDALKVEMKSRLDDLIDEWKLCVESPAVGESGIRAIMNAQANEIAIAAIRRAAK